MRYTLLLRNRRGANLVELSVGVLIAAVTSITVTALLMGSLDGWARGSSDTYSQTSASIAAQKIAQEIRDGQNAMVTSGYLLVIMPQKTTGAHSEVYYTRGVAGDTRVYYYDSESGSLMRTVNGTTTTLLKRISAANFVVSGKTITITISSHERFGDAARQDVGARTAVSTVRLRN